MSQRKHPINANFKQIAISLASPKSILERSFGEVIEPTTKNYRTYKSEEGGLFCPRLFGPEESWECACKKLKGIKYRENTCDRCGVEVNDRNVRRDRTAHVKVAVPVVHPFFYRYQPNVISLLLDIPAKKLESLIYYASYIVIQPGVKNKEEIQAMDFLTIKDYYKHLATLPKNQNLSDNNPDKFIAQIGAEAIKTLLSKIDLTSLSKELRIKIDEETSRQRRTQAIKRLEIVESFLTSERNGHPNQPEWMILEYIPVISPEYRPVVALNNGRFATSDITELLKRLIMRNNRLKKIKSMQVPGLIELHEKRMIQEIVDALFDNSTRGDKSMMESGRPLKSYAAMLTGKTGLLRGNLLGKRVDYSGRSVITVNPNLKLYECGLPKEMALILFRPFVIQKLRKRGLIKTFREGNKFIEKKPKVVWEILDKLTQKHPVILNRAPTLHRLSILGFYPRLTEGKSIQIHPLVCTPFNADFDGDQMAVHVPLSQEAIAECAMVLLAPHNLLNPSNGQPIMLPTREIVLGIYYLTKGCESLNGKPLQGTGMIFADTEEVISAYNSKKIHKNAYIKVRITNSKNKNEIIDTTVGRVIFNTYLPDKIDFVNETINSKKLRNIVIEVYNKTGIERTTILLDELKQLGFQQMHEGGLTFGIEDMKTPKLKEKIIQKGYEDVQQIKDNFALGLITRNERYNQILDTWTKVNNKLTRDLREELKEDKGGFNTVFMMMDSGARGSIDQVKQICGWRGLMSKPQKSSDGKEGIIEQPIIASFRDGLSPAEYFISNHGSRKALSDTTLKTADAGYFNRKLIDLAQNVIISEVDCQTLRGRTITPIYSSGQLQISIGDQVLGRELVQDLIDIKNDSVFLKRGTHITKELSKKIDDIGLTSVVVRSPIFCESPFGICSHCYGINLGTQKIASIGDAVGNIAAQSISEPSTQFTLRMFHSGGAVSSSSVEELVTSVEDAHVQLTNLKLLKSKNKNIVINRGSELKIISDKSHQEIQSTILPYGTILHVKDNQHVKKGALLFEWDPYKIPILTTVAGKVIFDAIEEGITYREEYNEQTGYREKIIIESQDKYKVPTIIIEDQKGQRTHYMIPEKAHISVDAGQQVEAGEILAKIARPKSTPENIVGGLQRITKLFEVQGTMNQAVISHIDGQVSLGEKKRAKIEVSVTGKDGRQKSYKIPMSKQLLVQDGDFVKATNMLCDGLVSVKDILEVKGVDGFCNYMIQQVQEVYRLQGITIADKHLEIILRQMLQKIKVISAGDTHLIPDQTVSKYAFRKANQLIRNKRIITNPGDTQFKKNEVVLPFQLEAENKAIKDSGFKPAESRPVKPAIGKFKVQGITSSAVSGDSFLAAMSFQETIKVIVRSSIAGKIDKLRGIKENIIACKPFPAGTGMKQYNNLRVTAKEVEKALVEQNDKS